MKISRRTVVLGGIAAPLAAPFAAQAQTWPSGVIKIIVPFPPGGSVDPIARLVQPRMQEKLGGATIIIENRPGASGSVGTAAVAKANPDGNSWVFVFDTHAVNPFLQDLSFNTEKDLDPVLLIGTAPNVLCTHPSRPFNSFAEVIAAAKQKPTTITYASIGSGSVGHLTMALLSKRAGVSMVHVPYRGGGPAVTDAIAGHVDLIIGSAALVTPQINGQRLRPLLQTGKARIASLPNTQTAIEAGFPGFESYAWWGVFAPANTPKPIIEKFGAALADSLRDPAVAKQLQENLQITLLVQDPEAERKFLQQQMALWGPVVKENNIKGD
ncbi:MAG TPA: tripartite tricarboxylate transporter substrate binding protein [Pseudolabrys sp.]|nr:tripartite tricarboxylate transporter substrate binding protein [Pseudolabrys sp.]